LKKTALMGRNIKAKGAAHSLFLIINKKPVSMSAFLFPIFIQ